MMGYWEDVVNSAKTGRSTKNTGSGGADRRRQIAQTANSRRINDTPNRPWISAGPAGTADAATAFWNGGSTSMPPAGPTGPGPNGPGGSTRWGGGGGGGGNAAIRANLEAILASRAFAPEDFSKDRQRVRDAVKADRGAANDEYNRLLNRLAGFANPFNYEVAGAPAVDTAATEALLRSQGIDPAAHMANVENIRAEGQQMRAGFTNMRDALAAAFNENSQSRQAEVGMSRAHSNRALNAERRALMQELDNRARQDKLDKSQQVLQLLMQMVSAGGSLTPEQVNQFMGR